jgi:hypothetical protein
MDNSTDNSVQEPVEPFTGFDRPFSQEEIDDIALLLSDATDSATFVSPQAGFDNGILPILTEHNIKIPKISDYVNWIKHPDEGEFSIQVGTVDEEAVHFYFGYFKEDGELFSVYGDLMNDLDYNRFMADLDAKEYDEYFNLDGPEDDEDFPLEVDNDEDDYVDTHIEKPLIDEPEWLPHPDATVHAIVTRDAL